MLSTIDSLPEEEREGTWFDLNDKAHEHLQKQDTFAGVLFDAGCNAGYYDDRDERFAAIIEAKKWTVTAEHKRNTILNTSRKLLPSHIQELESPEVSNEFLEQARVLANQINLLETKLEEREMLFYRWTAYCITLRESGDVRLG